MVRDDRAMVTIRVMEASDWETYRTVRLAALLDTPEAFGATYADEAARSADAWETVVRDRCESGLSATWLAELDGEVIGLVGSFRVDAEQTGAELVSMWVAPSARGHGVARRLVDAVLGWARDASLSDVSLWVTRGNDAAHALYVSAGFAVTGEYQALPSDPCADEIRMIQSVA